VFGPAARETGIPASVWRYYLISSRPETADAMFSWAECIAANNNVLLNNFGNFVNRVLKFVASQYDSVITDSDDAPGPYSPNDPLDGKFFADVNALLRDYINAMDVVKIRLGLQIVMLISNRANLYLQASGLNKALLISDPKRCAQVISRAVNLIYTLSALIYPFMPATSEAILSQLNAPARSVPDVISNDVLAGHTIKTPEHLFKKIEEKMAETWRAKFGGHDTPAPEPDIDPLKAAPGSKKKAGKKVAPVADGPKSLEVEALEAKVAEQGQIVRELKAKTPKTPGLEGQIKAAVDVLKAFKADLEKALSQQ